MRKSNLIFIPLILVFLLGGCFYRGGKFKLTFNLERGNVFNGEIAINQNLIQENANQKFETNQASTAIVHFTVKDIKNENIKIEMVYEDIYLSIKNPLIKIKFDSKNNNNQDGLEAIKDIINKKITIVVSTKGEIISMDGISQVLNTIIRNNAMNPMATATAITFLNEKQLKNNFSLLFNHLPGKKIITGDSWSQIQTLSLDKINLKSNNRWKLVRFTDETAYLNLKAKITSSNITGEQTGEFEIDRNTGWISSAQIKQNIPMNPEKNTIGINSEISFQFKKTK